MNGPVGRNVLLPIKKEPVMTLLRRLMSILAPGDPVDDAHVHFHRGPQGHPAVCHEPACEMPRLELTRGGA